MTSSDKIAIRKELGFKKEGADSFGGIFLYLGAIVIILIIVLIL